jgi:hypothetical protein
VAAASTSSGSSGGGGSGRRRGVAWHELAQMARDEARRHGLEDPAQARLGIVKGIAARAGYSKSLVSRALSALSFAEALSAAGEVKLEELLALPLPKVELIRRRSEQDPGASQAALAKEVLGERDSLRRLAARRGAQRPGSLGVPWDQTDYEREALDLIQQHMQLVTDLPTEARVRRDRFLLELVPVDALVQIHREGRLEFAAALEFHDFSDVAEPPPALLVRLAQRALVAASLVTRFFFVVQGSDRAVSALDRLAGRLRCPNVGIIRIEGARPEVVRTAADAPFPDRRDLLLDWATER